MTDLAQVSHHEESNLLNISFKQNVTVEDKQRYMYKGSLHSDSAVPLRADRRSRSSPGGTGWWHGQAGPRTLGRPDDTNVVWDQKRRRMKGEAPRDQTVTSHKALFTKDTHIPLPFLSLTPSFTKAWPSQSARAGTWETALILPRGLLAEDTNRKLRRKRKGGR